MNPQEENVALPKFRIKGAQLLRRLPECCLLFRTKVDLDNLLGSAPVDDGGNANPGVLDSVLAVQASSDRINLVLIEENGLGNGRDRGSNPVASVALAVEDLPAGLDGLLLEILLGPFASALCIILHDIFHALAADNSRAPGNGLRIPMLTDDIGLNTLGVKIIHFSQLAGKTGTVQICSGTDNLSFGQTRDLNSSATK